MESGTIPEAKYQKLASEYSKLRAQASVLRKAVLDEQSKGNSLREQLRQRETALRRCEQEVDSLGFRNRQLEHRVEVLQDEIATREGRCKRDKDEGRKRTSGGKGDATQTAVAATIAGFSDNIQKDALIFEELQKKIIENAQLTSLVDDKERDLQLHAERIAHLEQTLEKRAIDFGETEKRLRRDTEALQSRNSELETKLVEAASLLGSEDALSVSGSEHIPLNITTLQHNHPIVLNTTATSTQLETTVEERISYLEKEMVHWRTQYEIAKMNDELITGGGNSLKDSSKPQSASTTSSAAIASAVVEYNNCNCSSTAAVLTAKHNSWEEQGARNSFKGQPMTPTKEQLIYNTFSRKFEDLLKSKFLAESHIVSYETEIEHFQICLENATHELKAKDEQIASINRALQMLEEDLATTRINYEEQISVLTEQVISLSEQLAACK